MPYKTIRETVISRLRDEILSGNFSPGQELTAKTFAERFDCSLTPLREALSVLETEGLIEASGHRSVKICKLDAREIEKISEVRILLESYAWRQTYENKRPLLKQVRRRKSTVALIRRAVRGTLSAIHHQFSDHKNVWV